MNIKYLRLLAKEFPSIEKASCEKIKLQAVLKLPKGTEYFFSDLHGEYEAFIDLLRRASGVNKNKIDYLFANTMSEAERKELAYTVAYTREVLKNLTITGDEKREWATILIFRLVKILKLVSGKYSKHKVRNSIPNEYRYIIDELISDNILENRGSYYDEIIRTLVDSDIADQFIIIICRVIRSLTVDRLHILGDIFDRGPRPDIIMEEIINFHDFDIQWGNHDISWMGAYCGNKALMANVVRVAMGYDTMDVLENGYGINLRALSVFAQNTYKNDDCNAFMPKKLDRNLYDEVDDDLVAKMGKAMTIIQLKLEGELIKNHPEWNMNDRLLLDKIDFNNYTVKISGKDYELNTKNFPTIDINNPYKLTDEEKEVMDTIAYSFINNRRLRNHMDYLYRYGSLYKIYNDNLLFHGCVPLNEDGSFMELEFDGIKYYGKKLFDYIENKIIDAYSNNRNSDKKESVDFMWYLWAGPVSPVFGKSKIAMFEQKFLSDKSVQKEKMNPYFELSYDEQICNKIFNEFRMNAEIAHIINGHVPVKVKDGQNPVRVNGKLFVIDGGLAKAYQTKTGMAGYTLIINSREITLAQHNVGEPPKVKIVEKFNDRVLVENTSEGSEILDKIGDLQDLITAYKMGIIKESEGEAV